MNPELVLWSRVLLQAIWDLAGIKLKVQKSEAPRLQRRTRAWFLAVKDSPGSFIWICNILSLDPDAVRGRVLARPRAELRSLMTNPPPAWDAGAMIGLRGVEMNGINSEAGEELIAMNPDLFRDSVPSEETQRHSCEEAPVKQRAQQGSVAPVFHTPPVQGDEKRSQGTFI